MTDASLESARRILRSAQRLVIFTGAGVSADSGVPTFRGTAANTLWGKFDPRQLASPEGFVRDPKLVYDWYSWRRSQLANIQPNAAHQTIARWQEQRGAVVITQNVDGLHQRVAPAEAIIYPLHRTLGEDRCNRCEYRERIDLSALPALRNCPSCSALLRPAVVWFGESLDPNIWSAAERAAREADVMLVVGTSGEVYPAADLVRIARHRGAKVILVNLEPTTMDEVADVYVPGRAAEIIPQLD